VKTLVTGGAGFVGGALVRRLLERGEEVRALVRKSSDLRNLEGLSVEVINGDLRDRDSLRQAMKGCRRLYHVAACYKFWLPDPKEIYEVNVEGTKNLLEAAKRESVEQIVYTSTVGVLGTPGDGGLGSEETPVTLQEMVGHYKRSKYLAEQVALKSAEEGLPVVIVNPSTPVGPGDVKPTPTGQMIVDFLNGRMFAYIQTGLNLIDVADVAEGHILAAEKGKIGKRYILGHRNLTLQEIFELLGRISGIKPPGLKIPRWSVLPFAYLSERVSNWMTKTPPRIPLEGVKMAKQYMFFDASKAVRELGLPQSPIEQALKRAVQWFFENGYVKPHRMVKIRLRSP